jgi:SAM-dependent methyltransferase
MNSLSPPYDPRRFREAAAYYARYRLAYPQRLIARVTALAGLEAGDAVLDLGCGTGFLAVAFAAGGMAVAAADPEPAMLEAAGEAARKAGVRLDLRQGGSFELTEAMGPYRLVTMGRSFHWMDRAATLAILDRIVSPDGAIALFHDRHPDVEENLWFKLLCEDCTAHQRRVGRGKPGLRSTGGHRRYEPFLLASAFCEIETASVFLQQDLSTEDIVGRAFSQALPAPTPEFEADLRAGLAALSPNGRFVEIAEMVAVVARRPKKEKP